jgi:hypothetical protein
MAEDNRHPLVEDLKRAVPEDVLERFRAETCIAGDLEYKLPQVLRASVHDAEPGQVVDRAVHVINHCLLIREGLEIGKILDDDYFPPSVVQMLEERSCLSVVGDDERGNPVIYFNLKRFNPSEYTKLWQAGSRPVPERFRGHPELNDPCVVNYCSLWYVRMMEWLHAHRFDKFRSGGCREPKVAMVLNIEAAGLSTYTPELRQFLKGIKVLGGYLFPEICDYIYAANVPWIADKFWSLMKMILHPETVEKVNICDKSRTKKTLKDHISDESLPICFGGHYVPELRFKRRLQGTDSPSEPPHKKSHGACSTLPPAVSS